MRGRTNILPLVGGYVVGDTIECEVAETNGIGLGDFVQVTERNVEESGVVIGFVGLRVKLDSANGWASFVYGQQESNTSLYGFTIKEMVYQQNDTLDGETFFYQTTVPSGASQYSSNFNLYKVGTDKFVVVQKVYASTNYLKAFYFERDAVNGWSGEDLSWTPDTNLFQTPEVNTPSKYFEKVYGNTLIWGVSYTSGSSTINSIVVAVWDDVNKEFTATETTVGYAVTDVIAYDTTTNQFVICSFQSSQFIGYCYTKNNDNTVTYVNNVVIGNYYKYCSKTKVDGKWIVFIGDSSRYYKYYVYMTINQQGVSVGEMKQFEEYFVTVTDVVEYDNGKFIVSIYQDLRNGSGSGAGYRTASITCYTLVYDDVLDELLVGEQTVVKTVTYYCRTSTALSGMYLLELAQIDRCLCLFYYVDNGEQKEGTSLCEIVNNVIHVMTNKLLVKRYVNSISGIARTSGDIGDTIQVYVPYNS